VFLPQCETPRFMPVQTRVSLYLRVSVMRLLCYLGDPMVVGIGGRGER